MNRALVVALSVLIFAGLAWLLYHRLDWQERTIDLGWQVEAERSPFLAAKMLLEQSGVDYVEVRRVVPSNSDLQKPSGIILPDASFLPLPSQQATLLEWVHNGGNLLVGTGYEDFPPILKLLGFATVYNSLAKYEIEETEDDEPALSFADHLREESQRLRQQDETDSDANPIICGAPYDQCNELNEPSYDRNVLTRLTFDGDHEEIVLNLNASREITHPRFYDDAEVESDEILNSEAYNRAELFYWEGDANGIRFVQLNYGEGNISIIVDANIFSNADLAHYDHAYLLSLLMSYQDHVLLLEGKHMAPLSTLIWRHYGAALFGLVLMLILMAWHLARRFGAVRDVQLNSRRSREEGMRAIGQWYWRRGQFVQLLSPLRREIIHEASKKWPSFKRWPVDKQYRQFADFCGLELELITELFERQDFLNEQSFLITVKNLKSIRNRL